MALLGRLLCLVYGHKMIVTAVAAYGDESDLRTCDAFCSRCPYTLRNATHHNALRDR